MRFFALTTATADLPEVPDIQESLTAIQKFIKTASPVVLTGKGKGAAPDVAVTGGRLDIRAMPGGMGGSGSGTKAR